MGHVRGSLTVGRYAGIGGGTLIICHSQIDIGDYALIADYVSIFDTNSHSTDWRDRRRIIEMGYPMGALEHKRPESDAANRPASAPIFLGDDVWIGKNAMITKGCHIGARSLSGWARASVQ